MENKVTHGYIQKKIDQDPVIDTDATNKWLDQRFSAHIEGSYVQPKNKN